MACGHDQPQPYSPSLETICGSKLTGHVCMKHTAAFAEAKINVLKGISGHGQITVH